MKLDTDFIAKSIPDIAGYLPVTLNLVMVSFLISFPLGVIFALINHHRVRILSPVVRAYMSLIRGTPVVLQIYVIYTILPYILSDLLKRVGSDYNIYRMDTIYYGYIALSLSVTVSIAEAVRAGLAAVGRGQLESGLSVGMSEVQTFFHVIFPQAIAGAMPVLGNTVVTLIKSTSLAFMVAVTEITGRAKVLGGSVLRYFEAYICVFILYIAVITITEQLMKLLERRIAVYRVGRHRG